MWRRLIPGRLPEPKSPAGDVPEALQMLFSSLNSAAETTRNSAVDLVRQVVPELVNNRRPIYLTSAQHAEISEQLLAAYEAEFKRLCAPHDYPLLLCLSRLCSGLPRLRKLGESIDDIRVRCQTADYAVLAYGARDVPDSFEAHEDGFVLRDVPGDAVLAVATIHNMSYQYRGIVRSLISLNYLREFSREMREKGKSAFQPAQVSLDLGQVAIQASERAMVAEELFWRWHTREGTAVSPWGFTGFTPQITSPALIWMYPEIKRHRPWRGDVFFEHIDRGIRSLYEEGCRYRCLFERNIGMPPEHLCAIIEGLAQLAFRNETYGFHYSWWFALTGTMLVRRGDLEGGALLEEAQRALATYYPDYAGSTELAASLSTFVTLASSAGKQNALRLRGMQPTYLLLGEDHHDVWVVDYCGQLHRRPAQRRCFRAYLCIRLGAGQLLGSCGRRGAGFP